MPSFRQLQKVFDFVASNAVLRTLVDEKIDVEIVIYIEIVKEAITGCSTDTKLFNLFLYQLRRQ